MDGQADERLYAEPVQCRIDIPASSGGKSNHGPRFGDFGKGPVAGPSPLQQEHEGKAKPSRSPSLI